MSTPTLEVIAERAKALGYQAAFARGESGIRMLVVSAPEPRSWCEVRLTYFESGSMLRSVQSNDAGPSCASPPRPRAGRDADEGGLVMRWLCFLFGHSKDAGTDPSMSLVFHCPRCRRLVRGGLACRS